MNQEKKEDIVARPTVRAEIDRMLAELVPERFVPPPVKRTADMHLGCMATEEIKRLHTLRELAAIKREALVAKNLEIGRDAKERILSMDRAAANEEVKTPGSPLFVANETMARLERELRRTDAIGNLADMLLWLEVRRQNADLETRPVCICDDWSICWVNEDANKPAVITRVTIRDEAPTGPGRTPKRTVH